MFFLPIIILALVSGGVAGADAHSDAQAKKADANVALERACNVKAPDASCPARFHQKAEARAKSNAQYRRSTSYGVTMYVQKTPTELAIDQFNASGIHNWAETSSFPAGRAPINLDAPVGRRDRY